MGSRLMVMMAAMAFATVATADSWTFATQIYVFKFDDGMRFEFHGRPFQRARKPRTAVLISRHGSLLAEHPGLDFETVIASPRGNLFVALANSSPLSYTAVAVFTEHGNLILHANHAVAAFPYCEKTATTPRQWYDSANPDVRFDDDLHLAGITLNDCRGRRINLQRALADAVAAGVDRTEKRVGRQVPAPDPTPDPAPEPAK